MISERKCLCCDTGHVIKHGFYSRLLEDPHLGPFVVWVRVQRWLCKSCKKTTSTPSSEVVAYKRFDAAVIGRALHLHYHEGWSYEEIRDELDGPSFWVIRQWCRQFRSRSETVLQKLSRLGESVGKVFKDRADEVFSCLRRFAVKCGVDKESEFIQVVQPVLMGRPEQVPLFRSV